MQLFFFLGLLLEGTIYSAIGVLVMKAGPFAIAIREIAFNTRRPGVEYKEFYKELENMVGIVKLLGVNIIILGWLMQLFKLFALSR